MVVFMRELDAALSGKTPITELYTGFEVAKEEAELKSSPAFGDAKDYFFKLVGDVDAECMPIRDRDDKRLGGQEVCVAAPVDKKALEAFLKTSGATVNALWNAAFGFALAKFLARDNCVFTTVYNGRNDPRLLNSVGMFVHTLPVVCNFENGKTGADIVRLVARQLGDSMANDIYPFSEISRDLGVKADILFVYEGKIGTDFVIGGKKAENVRLKTNALKAEFSFFVSDADDGFAMNCEYDARYYEEWSVRSLVNSVVASFNALVRNERTEDIVLSKPEELARIDKDCFVERAVEDTDVVTLFTRAAKAYPDNTAIIFKDKRISYGELDKLTDRIAAYIQGLGIGKEDVVSILVPRCEYMAEAALGVLKSGAAYQPLDPSYPAERLNFMVKNAKAKLVIADNGLIGLLSDYEGVYLTLDEIGDLPDKKPADPDLSGKNLFIVLYTSGTTGTPKGVMLEHGNLVNFSSWYKDNYSLTPQSVVGAYASFGFDADMMDLYPALTTGACVYIIPEDMRLDLNLLEKSFVENGVTHIFMTTQMGRMFAENMKGESLKHLSVGGETLAPLDPPEGFGLWNGYGPTECTIFTTYQKIEKRYYRNPIGRALDNYKLYVVDKSGHRLPKGALGELWIAGKGVGRGYLDLPEQTKKTFIDNPFDNRAGYERVYRTGDVVRRLEDGTIDFIGRNDGQVKIRGFRIELSEVESVIRDYKGIKDVTVQAFDDKAFGGKFLAAYVVADSPVDFNALSDFIKESKPAYMVPAAFMQLDKIPLNQNQKVNKRALPEPERRADKKTDDLPATELEKEICEEFAKILGLKSVGATDDFFNLGGTSISAAKIVMFAMNKNYPVVYKDVFDNPTARDLARHINDEKGVENVVSRPDDEEITEPALKDNIPRMVDDIAADRPLGRTLLTGATGFLGSHVLKELVENGVETVVLCRGNKDLDAPTRLSAMMAYYFDDPMDEKIGTLIKVVDGDITNADLKEKLDGEHIDTVINCAACVKHFAKDDIIERINVGGAKNVIAVAKEKGARMIQISTLSVAGENVDGKFPPAFRMAENQLYFGQDISNKYVNSKFKAEEAVIRAIDEGLDGKIIRVGNLMGRQSDGEFQINSITNSFIKSLKAYKALGYFPVSACDAATDFSPIDMVAKAVVLLASTPDKFTVFHAANSHEVQMGDVIEAMNRYGFDIKTVPDDVFNEKLAEMMRDDNKKLLASSLLTYSSSDHHVHSFIKSDNTFSIKALYRLGYKWPITDANYLMRVIESLDSLGYFTRTDI
ncbi:MAG: amino acid adenylation domain-containing protein [Clostridia bacterium]|nr:amino acid adenylation domain-containing protein [Clostridia bacterium]